MRKKVFKNLPDIRKKCTLVEDVLDEVREILTSVLDRNPTVDAISAPQIGINERIILLRLVREENPVTTTSTRGNYELLVNPVITHASEERMGYIEDDLVFDEDLEISTRHSRFNVPTVNRRESITVSVSNREEPYTFKSDSPFDTTLDYGELFDTVMSDEGFYRSVLMQRHIMYLSGKRLTLEPVTKSNSSGRNDKVLVKKGSDFNYIKRKHLSKMEGWELV